MVPVNRSVIPFEVKLASILLHGGDYSGRLSFVAVDQSSFATAVSLALRLGTGIANLSTDQWNFDNAGPNAVAARTTNSRVRPAYKQVLALSRLASHSKSCSKAAMSSSYGRGATPREIPTELVSVAR